MWLANQQKKETMTLGWQPRKRGLSCVQLMTPATVAK